MVNKNSGAVPDTPQSAPIEPKVTPEATAPVANNDAQKPDASSVKKEKEEAYDLQLPEKSVLTKTDLERIVADAKARGLSKEEAQKLVERDSTTLMSYVAQQEEKYKLAQTQWLEATKSDKELGGENLQRTADSAKRVLDRFGSQELKDALNETGLGNHPELIRVFARIGKLMANDSFVVAQGSSGDKNDKKSPALTLYGEGK